MGDARAIDAADDRTNARRRWGIEPAQQIGGDHYARLDVQPWDAMKAWGTETEFAGFLRFNAVKYLARAGSKGPAIEDYRKARHYLDKLIATMESAT